MVRREVATFGKNGCFHGGFVGFPKVFLLRIFLVFWGAQSTERRLKARVCGLSSWQACW